LARAGEFDRRIVNDDADRAAAELCAEIRRLFETNQGRQPCSRS
jgi:hypothetical protein